MPLATASPTEAPTAAVEKRATAAQWAQLVYLASKLHEASIGRLDVFAAVFCQTAVV